MNYPPGPQWWPPYQLGHPMPARPRNWAGVVSLTSALLAWASGALGVRLLVASHLMTLSAGADSGCLVDDGLVNAGASVLFAGCVLSIAASATSLAGLIGRRRAHGVYRILAIAGLAMGSVSILICGFFFSSTLSPHAVNPAYRHQC